MSSNTGVETPLKRKKGFARLSPERRREVARLGGFAAQRSGHTFRWTSEEAKVAGRKGGLASKRRRRAQAGEQP